MDRGHRKTICFVLMRTKKNKTASAPDELLTVKIMRNFGGSGAAASDGR